MWAQLSSDSLGWTSQYRELKGWLLSKKLLPMHCIRWSECPLWFYSLYTTWSYCGAPLLLFSRVGFLQTTWLGHFVSKLWKFVFVQNVTHNLVILHCFRAYFLDNRRKNGSWLYFIQNWKRDKTKGKAGDTKGIVDDQVGKPIKVIISQNQTI